MSGGANRAYLKFVSDMKVKQYSDDGTINPLWVFTQETSLGRRNTKEKYVGSNLWSENNEVEYQKLWAEHRECGKEGWEKRKRDFSIKCQDPKFRKKMADDYIKRYGEKIKKLNRS